VRAEERRFAAKEQLDRYREPLVLAAVDLWHRVDNIRRKNFRFYFDRVDSEWRGRVAVLGTLYRFAKYWSVVDQVRQSIGVLRFEPTRTPVPPRGCCPRSTAHSQATAALATALSWFGGKSSAVWPN
jgi:hypothetical protein